MLLVILLSVAVVVISLLILLICKVKAWILTTPPLPDPLVRRRIRSNMQKVGECVVFLTRTLSSKPPNHRGCGTRKCRA